MPNPFLTANAPQAPMPGGAPQAAPQMANAPQPGAAPGQPPQRQVSYQQVRDTIMKQTRIDELLRGLLKSGQPISRKEVQDLAVTLVAERIMSPQQVAGYVTDLPDDPVQIRNWAMKHAAAAERGMDGLMSMIEGQMPNGIPGAQPAPAPQATDMGGAQP